MALNQGLVSQFAKLVNTTESKPETKTVTGTAKLYGGKIYVQIDGSDQLTPIASSTVGMNDGDRITVEIKNHSVSVTGNSTDPAASSGKLDEVDDRVHTNSNKIGEFNTLIADMVTTDDLTAINANIDNLIADNATITGKLDAVGASINDLEAKNVTITGSLDAVQADIDQIHASMLTADVADIKYATIDSLEATNANIHNLEADYGEFKQLSTEKLDAAEANIQKLDAEKLTATDADLKYANIDFANIGKAAIENFFSKSGMIGDLVVGDGTITGTLVGVTIKGDLIEGGTVKADKLVVQGEDGLYYKLNVSGETVAAEQTDYNSLNGSIITAKSVTAEKIAVNDLVAFGATIGGFHITEDSLYSGVKETVDNTTRGTYMNDDGEFAIGDGAHYLKFFKDADGTYKLAISASAIKFGANGTSIEDLANNTKLTDTVMGYIADIGPNAGKPPIEVTVYGNTKQNLWQNPSGTSYGVTVTSNDDGSITLSGTSSIAFAYVIVRSYILRPSTSYTLSIGGAFSHDMRIGCRINNYFAGFSLTAGQTSMTFTTPATLTTVEMGVLVNAVGTTVSGTYRVMLREATEDEIAAAQQTASTLQEGGTADLPQDYPVTLPADLGVYAETDDFDWCPPGINGVEPTAIVVSPTESAEDGTSTPIDMQGHALYSLPDGTRDELRIDSSGKVTLVQRVGADIIDSSGHWSRTLIAGSSNIYKFGKSEGVSQVPADNSVHGAGMCDKLVPGVISASNNSITAYGTRFVDIRVDSFDTIEEFTSWLSTENVLYLYPLATPVETDLGTIELPSLNPNYAYAWAVSDIPGEISVKYWTVLGKEVAEVQNEAQQASSSLEQSVSEISTKVEAAQNDATQAIEKTAELEQTAESITAEVSKVSETASEASKQATTAQQTAEGLTTKVEEAVNTAESAKTTATEAKQTADGLSTTVSEVKQTADGAMEKATTVAQTVDGLEVKIDGIADPKENILLNTQNFSYYSNGSANGALMSAPNVNGTYLGLTVRGTTGIPANQSTGASLGQYYVSDFSLGDKFTFSFYAKGTVDKFVCFFYGASGYVPVAPIKNSQGYSSTGYGDGRSYFTCSQSWRRYWVTWQLNSSGNVSIPKYVLIRTDANTVSSANMYVCGCRLETGDIANDWEPSPLDIGDAAKTATNYLKFDSSGLCVGNMTGSLGYNALITSSQYQIRNGGTVLSSFGASQVNLGQNSTNSQIKLCNGMGTIRVQQGATRDSLYVETAGDMVISGNGTNLYGAYINLNGATYAGSDFFAQNGRVALGHNGTTLWGVYCGTSIVNPMGNNWYDLFTPSQQVSMFGRTFNVDKGDVFLAMNGDTGAQNIGLDSTYNNGANTLGVSFHSGVNGNYRIQWLVVMGA